MSFISKCWNWVAEKVEAAWDATKKLFSVVVERVLDFCHATAEAGVKWRYPVSGKANVAKVATDGRRRHSAKPIDAVGAAIKAVLLKAGYVVTASAPTLGTPVPRRLSSRWVS